MYLHTYHRYGLGYRLQSKFLVRLSVCYLGVRTAAGARAAMAKLNDVDERRCNNLHTMDKDRLAPASMFKYFPEHALSIGCS
jgi:hypothetical protein